MAYGDNWALSARLLFIPGADHRLSGGSHEFGVSERHDLVDSGQTAFECPIAKADTPLGDKHDRDDHNKDNRLQNEACSQRK